MLQWELNKIQERIHILEAVIVFKYLDKVIKLIRTIDDPKKKIMSLCRLSDKQYDAIINMRIRSLAKLQEQILKKESKNLQVKKRFTTNHKTLQGLKLILKKDLKNIKDELVNQDSEKLMTQKYSHPTKLRLVPPLAILLLLSSNGWIRFIRVMI